MDDVGTYAAFGAVLGLVIGLVPLIYGLNKGETGLAWGGFGACIVGGAILGIFLAIPAAIVFTVLIRKNVKDQQIQQGAYGAVPPGPETMQATGAQQWGGQPTQGQQFGTPPAGGPPPPPPPPQQ